MKSFSIVWFWNYSLVWLMSHKIDDTAENVPMHILLISYLHCWLKEVLHFLEPKMHSFLKIYKQTI